MPIFGETKVEDVMTARPRAIRPDTSTAEAAQIMAREDVGALPVLGAGEAIAGIVTDRDLTLRVLARGADPERTTVGEVASGDLVTVNPDDDIDTAMELMERHQVRRLPVVEKGERLVGIVAQADLARESGAKDTGEVVGEISEPRRGPRV